jgi:hypothetical protein
MVVGLRLHGKDSGERGPHELEVLGTNRGVFRAADEEVELTEAVGAEETRRRPQNEQRSTKRGDGASWVHAQGGRERGSSVGGATGQGE